MINVTVDREGGFSASRHWGGPQPPQNWWAKLYVDPKDGLIKRTDKLCRKLGVQDFRSKLRDDRKRRVQGWRFDHNLRVLTETRFLVKLKGCWFQVDTDVPPMDVYGRWFSGRDLVDQLNGTVSIEACNWRVIAKNQLSKKELKAHKLSND